MKREKTAFGSLTDADITIGLEHPAPIKESENLFKRVYVVQIIVTKKEQTRSVEHE
jgi:hypothetical protein